MATDASGIDWEGLKQDATAPTRLALEHLQRLSLTTAARMSVPIDVDAAPRASGLALAVAIAATIRVLFGIGGVAMLGAGTNTAIPLWAMSIAALVFTVGGITLWVGGERDWRARHLGLSYLTLGGAFVSRHLTEIEAMGSSSIAMCAVGLRAVTVEAFIPYYVLAFFESFPRVASNMPAQRAVTWFKHITLMTGLVLAGINAVAWLSPLATGAIPPIDTLRPWLPTTTGRALFWAATLAPLVPAAVIALMKARSSRGEERQRAWLLLVGVVIAIAPFTALLIASDLTGWFVDPAGTRAAALFVYPALLTLPVSTAYAVLARGALDIRVLVRNAAHHALARWVLTAASIVPLLVTAALAYDYRAQTLESLLTMPSARGLLLTAAVALVLTAARTRLLAAIDRVFLRSVVDSETLVSEVGERARRLPSAYDVAADLSTTIAQRFGVEQTSMLVADPKESTFEPLTGKVHSLLRSSALADLVASTDDVLTTEQPTSWIGLLPHRDQAWLAETGVEALVPLHGRGDRVIGIMTLGHRRGDWTYTPRERRTLKAVVAAVAPVLERHLDAQFSPGDTSAGGDDALLVCVECGAIHAREVRRCPCGGAVEGGVIPRVVGRKYEVTRRLGRGAMGVVYEARDQALERMVAIKALPHLSFREGERLVQEARRMTRVTHPNLAYVLGLETFNGMPLVVMELLAGRTLRERIARGPLAAREVVRIGIALADALARLHQAGLLHRDIKPGNVGFDAEGTPKLLDFGLALPIEVTKTATVSLAGTPLYLPPEAWRGQPADHHMDLWALAITLSEALLGSHPLAGISAEEIETGGAARASDVVHAHPLAGLPGRVLANALAPDPDSRFRDAQDFRSALTQLVPSTTTLESRATEHTA